MKIDALRIQEALEAGPEGGRFSPAESARLAKAIQIALDDVEAQPATRGDLGEVRREVDALRREMVEMEKRLRGYVNQTGWRVVGVMTAIVAAEIALFGFVLGLL